MCVSEHTETTFAINGMKPKMMCSVHQKLNISNKGRVRALVPVNSAGEMILTS